MKRSPRIYVWLLPPLIALLLSLLAERVHAAFPAPVVTEYSHVADFGTVYTSWAAACDARLAFVQTDGLPHAVVLVEPGNCYINTTAGAESSWFYTIYPLYQRTVATCPANSTLSGGSCTCTAPAVQNATDNGCTSSNTCGSLGTPVAGSSTLSRYAGGPGYSGGLLCRSGCAVAPGSAWKGPDGVWTASGPLTNIGVACPSTTTPGGDAPAAGEPAMTCPTGQCPGSINGTNVCVPCSAGTTDTKTTDEKTATPPTGGASAPAPGTPGVEPAGTSTGTSTSKTTCEGANCTTTITSTKTGTDGNAQTVTTTKTEPKEDFCTKSPKSPLCINSTFSGSCDGGFSFEGDAIQGALAKEVHKQNCIMNKVTAESALYDIAKTKTGDVTDTLPGNTTVNIGPASFDTSDSIGGKQCIGNVTGTVLGTTITLPFGDYICPHAQNLRLILIALGFITGYFIIARRS